MLGCWRGRGCLFLVTFSSLWQKNCLNSTVLLNCFWGCLVSAIIWQWTLNPLRVHPKDSSFTMSWNCSSFRTSSWSNLINPPTMASGLTVLMAASMYLMMMVIFFSESNLQNFLIGCIENAGNVLWSLLLIVVVVVLIRENKLKSSFIF